MAAPVAGPRRSRRVTPPRALVPAAMSLAVAVVVWLVFAPARFLNYDTAYALLWGADLADGRTPDYEVPFAPTPHPLAEAVGFLLSLPGLGGLPRGAFQEGAWEVGAFLALGVLAWLVFALGRAWFGAAAGVLAALIVLTREPILSYGIRAYVDVPYLCLLLGALLVETRRRRAGTPVLVLLLLAGLLRPEAWLFAGLYGAWLWRGGALRPVHVGLVVGAPLLWALSDLAITGDLLHSLTGTRETAGELQRVTGLDDVPATLPRRLGEILREPVLVGAAAGGVLALWRLRGRAALGAVAGVAAVVAFCVLAAAGLPILTRYLLLPAVVLAIFCGAGVFGWRALPRDDPARRTWIVVAVVTMLLLAAFTPRQVDRLDRLQSALATQTAILDELRGFFPDPVGADCRELTLPNRRAVPQVALWSHRAPATIRSAQTEGVHGTYFAPASPDVAEDFVLDAKDRDRRVPPMPAGRELVPGTYWSVGLACSPSARR